MKRNACSNCGVLEGQFHQYGCKNERCPFCRRFLATCNCIYKYLGLFDFKAFPNTGGVSKNLSKEKISKELESRWIVILEKKGRIAYVQHSRVCYRCGKSLIKSSSNVVDGRVFCDECYTKIERWKSKEITPVDYSLHPLHYKSKNLNYSKNNNIYLYNNNLKNNNNKNNKNVSVERVGVKVISAEKVRGDEKTRKNANAFATLFRKLYRQKYSATFASKGLSQKQRQQVTGILKCLNDKKLTWEGYLEWAFTTKVKGVTFPLNIGFLAYKGVLLEFILSQSRKKSLPWLKNENV